MHCTRFVLNDMFGPGVGVLNTRMSKVGATVPSRVEKIGADPQAACASSDVPQRGQWAPRQMSSS